MDSKCDAFSFLSFFIFPSFFKPPAAGSPCCGRFVACSKRRHDFLSRSGISKEASQSSPPAGGEKSEIIFSGGVYVGENTAQPASVRIARL